MQPVTFEIGKFESEIEAKKKGFDISITNKQYDKLKPMNRKQRREWARKNKKIIIHTTPSR